MKTILVDAIHCLIDKDGSVFTEMYELLEKYQNPKIILTGADDGQWQKFKLDDAPYEVFTLKHSPEKTDPEYYRKMLKHFELEPSNVVYFEHDPEAVKSAESVGIVTHYYNPDKKDLEALKNFLDTNL